MSQSQRHVCKHQDQDLLGGDGWSGVLFDSRLASRVSVRRRGWALVRRGADELHTHVRLQEVDVQALDAARLESLVGAERMARFEEAADAAQASLAGHAVLNVNSTATGGGVAEIDRKSVM